MPSVFRRLLIAAPLALAAAPAWAQSFENLDALEMRVVAALGANIGEPGGPMRPIDRRIHLAPCPRPETIDAPALGAVTVRCEPLGWRIRVPLSPNATAAAASPAGGQESDWGLPQTASSAPAARAPAVVHRGDVVTVVVETASFTVSSSGTAEQDGAAGARIRVRTDQHLPPVMGQVLPDGRVAVGGFN